MRRVKRIAPPMSRQLRHASVRHGGQGGRTRGVCSSNSGATVQIAHLAADIDGVIIETLSGATMAKTDPKKAALQAQGALHPRPDKVVDELFEQSDFFDARDVVQVKYEMLRRVRVDGRSVTRVVTDFGFSRPTYYQAKDAFEDEGIPGLVPKKRGPKAAHKLTREIVNYLERVLEKEPSLRALVLAERITKRFGIRVHPRSVERALARRRRGRRQKKGLQ